MKCQRITAVNPKINPPAINVIRQIQSGTMRDIDGIIVSDDLIAELRPVLKLHMEYHLGQRPRTANYME